MESERRVCGLPVAWRLLPPRRDGVRTSFRLRPVSPSHSHAWRAPQPTPASQPVNQSVGQNRRGRLAGRQAGKHLEWFDRRVGREGHQVRPHEAAGHAAALPSALLGARSGGGFGW